MYMSRGGEIKQWVALGYRCEDTALDQQVSASSTTVIYVLMLWVGKIEIGRELRYFRTNVVGGVGESDRPTSRSLAVFKTAVIVQWARHPQKKVHAQQGKSVSHRAKSSC